MLNGWWLAANAFILIVFGTNLRVIRRKSTKQPRVHLHCVLCEPGAMHPLLPSSSAIPKDAEDNKVSMTTKLTMPVLAIGGAKSFGANVAIVMRNAADNVTEVVIANSAIGSWRNNLPLQLLPCIISLTGKPPLHKSLPGSTWPISCKISAFSVAA